MRAAIYTHTGPSSVLDIVGRPLVPPGPGEVRVRLVRSGVNPTDWKFRASVDPDFPEVTPGHDGAGIVDAVGAGVTRLAPGDRVWVLLARLDRSGGTAAEFTVQPEDRVQPLAPHASFDLGASLGVPAVTAHRALTSGDVARLSPGALRGRAVLVAGGAGAVGHAAIQLARWAGATVLTTVSNPQKAALARAAGADHVIDYRTQDVAAEVRSILGADGVDLVVEVALAPNLRIDLEVVRTHGTVAFYANDGGDEAVLPVRGAFSKNLRVQGLILYTLDPALVAAAVADVGAALDDGALSVGADVGLPVTTFGLDEVAAAHDAVEAGTVGKVLLALDHE